MRREYIVIHHSLTKDGETVSWAAIERYHVRVNRWRDIGYHAGVELVAGPEMGEYAYQGLIGRAEDDFAAACPEAHMNQIGLHLCLVGNFDLTPPPKAMLVRAAVRFIIPWMRRYDISPERVIGHRDAGLMAGFDWEKGQYKSCPGTQFDLDLLRGMLG